VLRLESWRHGNLASVSLWEFKGFASICYKLWQSIWPLLCVIGWLGTAGRRPLRARVRDTLNKYFQKRYSTCRSRPSFDVRVEVRFTRSRPSAKDKQISTRTQKESNNAIRLIAKANKDSTAGVMPEGRSSLHEMGKYNESW